MSSGSLVGYIPNDVQPLGIDEIHSRYEKSSISALSEEKSKNDRFRSWHIFFIYFFPVFHHVRRMVRPKDS